LTVRADPFSSTKDIASVQERCSWESIWQENLIEWLQYSEQPQSSRAGPSPPLLRLWLMRDIRTDLQDRANSIAHEISAENARFASLVSQIESEQSSKLTHLRAQLRLANKLIEFTLWHDNLRVDLTARISAAEAVENIIEKSSGSAPNAFIGHMK
jgi:hypothetical protein